MDRDRFAYYGLVFLVIALILMFGSVSATNQPFVEPSTTPNGRIATDDELVAAWSEWETSAHADTYDDGIGANTTCARCKSPLNWDPISELAEAAQDCGSCKRIPGAPRPDLEGGIPVPQSDWKNIGCEICHRPTGDSFYVEISFWNQAIGDYEPVNSPTELCEKCHSGRHGFEVIKEQAISEAHQAWDCTECHGSHGSDVLCTDCHDPDEGEGAFEHQRHPNVNCTACHDGGGLSIWKDTNPDSRYFGQTITRRFAHTLTSWPSHNIVLVVKCERCHHPISKTRGAIEPDVGCEECHDGGAVWVWCDYFPRDPNPDPRFYSDDYGSRQP